MPAAGVNKDKEKPTSVIVSLKSNLYLNAPKKHLNPICYMNKILVLGAGLVAKPLVEYLLAKGYKITVASNTPDNADKIINGDPGGRSVLWDAGDEAALGEMIGECDLAISLLPYKFHTQVARLCIKKGRHMVTTSYVKEEMKSLDSEARRAGVLLLNEIGLDPGIDHMSAMRIIDGVHKDGGKIEGFYSICGALPAPEAADNPFRYKFSWSPGGVILASKNSARYLLNGAVVDVPSEKLFRDRFSYSVDGVGELEVYPNRDSISYIDIYGIHETSTIMRGTFRHPGWCEILDAMRELNLLNEEKESLSGLTYAGFLASRLPAGQGSLAMRLSKFLRRDIDSEAIRGLEWLGLLCEEKIAGKPESSFDMIFDLMTSKMMLGRSERDMVVLKHIFLASRPDGKREVITSMMVDYGTPSTNTSIARTVGLPAAIAADMILKKEISVTGVHIPVIPEIYNPVLDRLGATGISLTETFGLPESDFIG